MRLGEECPYITPCGWCSRQEKPCEKRNRHKGSYPMPIMTEEEARAMGYLSEKPVAEPVPLEEDEAWQQTLSGRKS